MQGSKMDDQFMYHNSLDSPVIGSSDFYFFQNSIKILFRTLKREKILLSSPPFKFWDIFKERKSFNLLSFSRSHFFISPISKLKGSVRKKRSHRFPLPFLISFPIHLDCNSKIHFKKLSYVHVNVMLGNSKRSRRGGVKEKLKKKILLSVNQRRWVQEQKRRVLMWVLSMMIFIK